MNRKLASIQRVVSVEPIEGANSIEAIRVMGWSLFAKKGEFRVGDLCVFFEIDSVLPEGPSWSEFMRNKKFRVKTMKLASLGVVSQGLALPVSILPPQYVRINGLNEGADVTELLEVRKHFEEADIPPQAGSIAGLFPTGVPKTDEVRIQSALYVLDQMRGKAWYATLKLDGTSWTAMHNGESLTVASRRFALKDDGNAYWAIANRHCLTEKLAKRPYLAIQGELCGPKIQQNRMGFKEHQLFLFNAYDVKAARYYSLPELYDLAYELEMQTAPLEYVGLKFDLDLDQLVKMSRGDYAGTNHPREGIVVRPIHAENHAEYGQLSFKVINPDFLLKIGG